MKAPLPIQNNVALKPYNTFGLEANARYFLELNSLDQLTHLNHPDLEKSLSKLILGGGSNILFTQDFPGLVIKNSLPGIKLLDENSEHVWLEAGAGENWHQLVLHCVNQGWGGIENLSLIPGTVGAAPIQNIGAYGVELKETFQQLTAFDLIHNEARIITTSECNFGYRDSIFKNEYKNRFMICSVTLRLNKKPRFNLSYGLLQETLKDRGIKKPSLKSISDAVIQIRQSKLPDPKVIGNAGSFFKNPEIAKEHFDKLHAQYPHMPHFINDNGRIKIPAAWLIEQCGWKGKRVGDAGVHEKQALVLVNYNQAKGREIKKLAEEIQASVLQKFSIALSTEVNVI